MANGNQNQNAFRREIAQAVQRNESEVSQQRHEKALEDGRLTMMQEDLMEKIKAAEGRAIRKSAWVSVAIVVAVTAAAGVLLWPAQQQTAQKIARYDGRINTLEGAVAGSQKKQALFEKMIPADLQQKLAQFQDQAISIQQKVSTVADQAEHMASDLARGDMTDLAARLGRLEQQVASMTGSTDLGALIGKVRRWQTTPEGQQKLSGAMAQLSGLVSGLGGDTQQLDAALQTAQMQDDDLGQALEGVAPADLKAAALLMALNQFRTSMNRSGPFDDDLALLQKMVGTDDPDLNTAIQNLAPQAAQGVLSTQGLSNELKGLAGDIVVASLKGEDVSVKDRALARLNDVLQVRKDGKLITGTDTQAKVVRAQQLLDEGDVQGAIAILQSLDASAAQTAQPWINQAQQTLMAHKVQDMLTHRVTRQLTRKAIPGTAAQGAGEGLKDIFESLEGFSGTSGAHKPIDLSTVPSVSE